MRKHIAKSQIRHRVADPYWCITMFLYLIAGSVVGVVVFIAIAWLVACLVVKYCDACKLEEDWWLKRRFAGRKV